MRNWVRTDGTTGGLASHSVTCAAMFDIRNQVLPQLFREELGR